MQPLSQLSSTSSGSKGSGSFQVGVDYADSDDFYSISEWPVQPVTEDASSSPTTGLSHVPELVDCLTLLAHQIVENNNLMRELIQTQRELALAIREDGQEEEDQPSRYMDGSPIR